MDLNLPARVVRFLCEFWDVSPDKVRPETRLEDDLGMTGSDASEFFEAFAGEFEVDLTGIEFHKHFGPEFSGFVLWPRWLEEEMRDLGKYPVTTGHLIDLALAKRWICPPYRSTKKWPPLPRLDLWDHDLWDQDLDGDAGPSDCGTGPPI